MDCRCLEACGKHYTASYVYCNKVKVQMTFTNCFARRLNMLHKHTLVGERAKPHTNWSKWKIAIFICYTYVTQNAHALTHAHEIATKQRHNKQSFSLIEVKTLYCSEYYGTQRTRKEAKEGSRTPSRN